MAIVRDTHENLKSSIVKSIQKFFSKNYTLKLLRPKNDWKQLKILMDPVIEIDLFGIDDLSSLSRLQGPEYALIWLNEPSPMISGTMINAGLSEEVYKASLVRCARQEGAPARLQIDMNPSDTDHWTFRQLIDGITSEPCITDPRTPLITKAVFKIPYGENFHQNEIARQAVINAYKDDPAGETRYVKGDFAVVYLGPKVTPQYNNEPFANRLCHLAHDIEGRPLPLEPATGLVSFAFFDSWSNPSCVLGQITQNNRLVFLDTLRLEDSDIETLLQVLVVPMLESPRWQRKSRGWRIGGDCTMENMDQTSKLRTAARAVMEVFPGCRFESGPTEWQQIQALICNDPGATDKDGAPMVLLSGDNRILDRALAGGWHYRMNAQGQKTSTTPVKDAASHPCDAFANAICVLLPSRVSSQQEIVRARQGAILAQRRAATYVTGMRR